MKNEYSKKVIIKRLPKKTKLPIEIWETSVLKIGAVGGRHSGVTARCLSATEEKKYLPGLVGVDVLNPEYKKLSDEFLSELSISVPIKGVELEIGYDKERDEPINVLDWIKFKHAMNHPWVAESEEDLQTKPNATFFIYDKNKDTDAKNAVVDSKKKANLQFAKLSEQGEQAMAMVARIFGIKPKYVVLQRPETLPAKEVENMLYDVVQEFPQEFLAAVLDKNIELRSDIYKFVTHNLLKKIGNQYLYGDEKIGNDLDETVTYLKDKNNSGVYAKLNAQYQEQLKSK